MKFATDIYGPLKMAVTGMAVDHHIPFTILGAQKVTDFKYCINM